MEAVLRLYLPGDYGSSPQWKAGWGRWRAFDDGDGAGFFTARVEASPDARVRVRYRGARGYQSAPPLEGCENLNGRYFLHRGGDDAPPAQRVRTGRGKICLECPLEGILAGYREGRDAPMEIQDLLLASISRRMIDSGLIAELAEREFDEVMAPVFPSVADRSCLNPKFNYLTMAAGEVDWQIGRPAEFRELVAALRANGIELVPDMIFAHFVKSANSCALDSVRRLSDGKPLFADDAPTLFRDYGTWMYDLANPEIRRILIRNLIRFFRQAALGVLRVDYVDGMIFQYAARPVNYGEVFLRELAAEIRGLSPKPVLIGEAFSTAGNPAVRELIDIPYCPRGFAIAEELYKPGHLRPRPDYPDANVLADIFRGSMGGDGREAVYAQLHDETWSDEHISAGRPHVPWAYGANPAELARAAGQSLIKLRQLAERDLLDFTRRLVRSVESLSMFLARLRYMTIPAVDSLSLGGFDHPGRWRMEWGDPVPQDMAVWRKTGLSDAEIFRLHDQHRSDMRALRGIWRRLTPIDEDRQAPLCVLEVVQCDARSASLAVLRRLPGQRQGAHVVVWNLGQQAFEETILFEVPVPMDLRGQWKVLFDGDGIDAELLFPGEVSPGYALGSIVPTTQGEVFRTDNILRLSLGASSMVLLEFQP